MHRTLLRLLCLGTLLVPALVGAVTEADFEVKTTQNLLNLCTASPNNPRHREAIHFCHGYLMGAFHYHEAQAAGPQGERLFCFTSTPPSRNDAITMLVAWLQAHPQYMNELPVETEFRFLSEKWPCKK